MREALTRLLGEALVTSEGQRGFRVAPASLEDFHDLTEVRQLVETEALRQSIARGDEAWESQIVAAFYRLSKVEERVIERPRPRLQRIRRAQPRIPQCADRGLSFALAAPYRRSVVPAVRALSTDVPRQKAGVA